jgi:hypothetical protein
MSRKIFKKNQKTDKMSFPGPMHGFFVAVERRVLPDTGALWTVPA